VWSESKVGGGPIERIDPLAPGYTVGGAVANDYEAVGGRYVDDLAVVSLCEEVGLLSVAESAVPHVLVSAAAVGVYLLSEFVAVVVGIVGRQVE